MNKGRTARHFPRDHLEDDSLEELREPLAKALDLDSADFDRLSPEVKNLLSARRRLGVGWLDDYEVVVEVIANDGCGCGVKPGQVAVFDMRHRIKPEKSDMSLCMHLLSPVLAIFYMSFDRASEGLNPLTRIWNHYECLDTRDDDGMSKARVRTYLRRADTHEMVTEPVLDTEDTAVRENDR